MVDLYSSLQAREPRYRVAPDQPVRLQLERREPSQEEGIQVVPITPATPRSPASATGYAAELLDLSCGGAKLRVPKAVDLDEEVWIRIQEITPGVDLVVSARICWTVPDAHGGWHLGCEISPKFPADFLEGLAEAGMVERRGYGRVPVDLAVGAKSDTSPQWRASELVDYSSGGFCVTLPHYDGQSQRLLLMVHHPDGREFMIPATIQWVATKQGRLLAGCEFIRRDGFELLNQVVNNQAAAEPEPDSQETGLGRWTWLLTGAALMAAGVAWLLSGLIPWGGATMVAR